MANKTEEKNRKRLLYFLNIKTSKPSCKYSLKSSFALFKDLDQYLWEIFPESYMHLFVHLSGGTELISAPPLQTFLLQIIFSQ